MQVGLHGAGQHDPGPVIPREHERLFDRTRGQYDFACAQLPQALARLAGSRFREMIAEALVEPDRVVRKVTERRGARQQPHTGIGRECGDRPLDPLPGGKSINPRLRVGQQRPARFRLFVAEDHPRAGIRGRHGRGKSRGPGADDQDIAVRMALRVTIRIRQLGRAAESRRGAD